ncbi:hypothetical protein FS837_006982 [Tulasnella sp. UAMH 9824]|nr:hypothetical protein FS837_006982 [Tulasnella sp. UAMH 9824]
MEDSKAVQVVFKAPERSAYIDFSQQASLLLSCIPSHLIPNDLLENLAQTSATGLTDQTLSILSKCLAIPTFTATVAELFSPLLVDFCSRWLEDESVEEVARLEALALLLESCEELSPIVHSFLSRQSLSVGPLGSLLALQASQIAALSAVDLHRILLAYYRLLHAEPELAKLFNWPSKALLALLSPPHPDLSVRALAIECYALHERLPEEEKVKTSLELLGPPGEADIPIFCGEAVVDGSIQPRQIDGWLLPLLEPLRVSELRAKVQLSPPPTSDAFSFSSELLHSQVANVGGVLLCRFTSEAIPPSPLVETPGSLQALKPMALQLSRRVPTLITSPPGSGKSLLIQHLATLLFPPAIAQNQVVTIHLSDTSLDAKSLLGSYSSSSTMPGTFEWVEGTIVRAMRAGKWLVFKDVDKASAEVLGMTLPLVESLGWTKSIGQRAAINVPGRSRVEAADSFILFATRSAAPTSLDPSGKPVFPSLSFLGNHHWNEVQAKSPSYDEQKVILGSKFPKLAGPPLRVLLDIWKAVQGVLKTSPKASGGVAGTPRDVGPRDLENLKKNEGFLDGVGGDVRSSKWKRVVKIWKTACTSAKAKFDASREKASAQVAKELDAGDSPRKRRKVEDGVQSGDSASEQDWKAFEQDVATFEAQHILAKSKFVFTFVEGPLIKALRQGHWVLLDEINLGSPETLEAITPLLQSPTSSITLTEQGSLTPIPRHASFRIFASMNPATDVGKKDLPPNLRSRFTELWVPPPDDDKEALLAIVKQYIGHCSLADSAAIMDVAEFYTEVRRLTESRAIADGSNKRPHFSMRTLARALTFTADVTPVFGLRRALWEGCLMAFTMTLDAKSADIVKPLAERWILRGVKNVSSVLSSIPMLPKGLSRDDVVQVGPFWLQRGPLPLQNVDDYILTPSVQRKLIDLSRIILTRRFPVLIEGPTSAGKTSAIEYLARRTGHRFVRINNHEHTDIQEYLGTYVSDPDSGKLVFHDGLLVRALREGHWIVLDELNLAPTDVLESLNRLLDDNRELVIPETQETVRPHPSFMLFATQNPAGLYGGRKVLSRAFRNRFLEVHFTDVPQAELEVILAERCKIPPSRAQRIVAVFEELQKRRQTGRVFETKQGFATLRDLFRWANRDWKDKEGLTNQDLAEDGYMLLAERARNADDKAVVKEVLETVLKVNIDDAAMYRIDAPGTDLLSKTGLSSLPSGLVWTQAFQRLFVLVSSALKHNEPVLLVGETGCGKTSVCELFARAHGRPLYTLNCHQNTETADLLGGQRPLRNRASLRADAIQDALSLLQETGIDTSNLTESDSISDAILRASVNKAFPPTARERVREVLGKLKRANALFEWHDGPLVEAMRNGGVFLLDEISLADDSVLERLNSVLEPARTLTLAEKGGWDIDRLEVAASTDFELVATMNPGGDYGKKELSPALRNRFTEIWVPLVESRSDKMKIIETMWHTSSLKPFSSVLLDFCQWLSGALGDEHTVGLRDIIAWVEFTNAASLRESSISSEELFHHAAHMTLLDGLASLPQTATFTPLALANLEREATSKLHELVPFTPSEVHPTDATTGTFRIEQFGISMGLHKVPSVDFNIRAPTTRDNAARVLRACQVQKPILLEGSPGVGKSSLIAALANFTGHRLCRINLSDQTDLMDLYGSDLPVEGGKPGEFVWKDAAFLRALQEGDWVLLDEMNLAPQAVLEGLNAVLDHRGTVYIPELGRSFTRHPNFRIFAAQNPLHQGGGRKGLPKSFLNRFTKVYVRELSPSDYHMICAHLFPEYPSESLHRMITFNARLHEEVMVRRSFGREGSPWEFNLRDLLRWLALMHSSTQASSSTEFISSVYLRRFRNETDRLRVWQLYAETFNIVDEMPRRPAVSITPRYFQVGHTISERRPRVSNHPTHPLRKHTSSLEAMSDAVRQGSLVIISGKKQSGKTSLVRLFASISGVNLQEFSMHPAVDTGDLLGSFEQLPHQTFDPSNSPQARFGWIDGPLVTAIKQGQWLLLDNANLCNPSVLDRLNSLCETNGSLVLSERGLVNGEVQVLIPHSDFRLFMVTDPQHGELSRAMRNRGVEITVDSQDDMEDTAALSSSTFIAFNDWQIKSPSTLNMNEEVFLNTPFDQALSINFPLHSPIDVILNTDLTAAVGDGLAFTTTIILDAVECLFRQFGNSSSTAFDVSSTRRSALERSYAIFVGKLSQAEAAKGLAEIYPLIKAIQDVSTEVLSGLEMRLDQDAATVLRTTNAVLAFAQQLVLVTQSRELDYSAIQTIATWFCEIRPAAPSLLDEVFTRAEQLQLSTSTTRGQAMGAVWRSRLLKVLPQQLATNLQTLDTVAMPSNQEQRRLAFDLMAVATLEGNVAASAEQVEELLNSLGQGLMEAELASSSEKIYIAIIESRALHSSAYVVRNLKKTHALEKVSQIAIETPFYPLLRLTPIRHAIWLNDSGSNAPMGVRAAMWTSWCKSLWSAEHDVAKSLLGPGLLLKPSLLQLTFFELTSATGSLAKLTDYEKRLTRIASLARAEFEDAAIKQDRLLAGILLEQVGLFFETFASSYHEVTFAQIQQDLFQWSSAVLEGSSWSQPQSLSTAITSSRTPQLVEVYDRMLRPALENLAPVTSLVARVAKGFVSIGLSTLALYVPDAPLDPIVAQRCARDLWEREECMLKARILVNRRAEYLVTGNGSNLSTMELEKRLQVIQERLDGIGTDDIGREPDVKRLHALFTELHQFCQDIVGQNRVEELVAFIETSSTGARQREATFQGSVHGFLQRLESTYSDLSDIATPFAQAVELIRFGIRILLEAGDFDDQLPDCVSAMLACPPVTAFPSLRTIDLEGVVRRITSTTTRVDLLVHNLRLAAQDRAAGLFTPSHLAVITERYDQLLRLWLDDQEAERKEAQEASSLYRQRKQDQVQLSDEELEEREFNQLFPKFTDEAQQSPDTEPIPRGPRSLNPKVHRKVFELHQELFSEGESRNLAKVDSRDAVASAAALLQDLGGSHRTDEDTVCARLLMLQDRLHFIQNANLNDAHTFDFYHDPNVPETRKVIVLLGEFIKKVNDLLAEWPEQLVLRHLNDRAEEILNYSMDSPVAKVLSALERLLLQTEDWERYAHKGNSLKTQQQAITAQIVEWRRLELSCWSRLLEVQASTFASAIDVWWFRLYEAAVHGSMAAAKSPEAHAVDQHIQKLSPLLDQYMVGSPSGQYSSRLLLLSTFANFTHQVVPLSDTKTGATLTRVTTLLRSTHEYWKQFEPEVLGRMTKDKEKLDGEIKDFIKLASWRDINVHALKASAEKTHRHLHRSIRKFKDILQQPVEPVISSLLFEAGSQNERSSPQPSSIEYPLDAAPVEDLPVKVKTLVEVVQRKLYPFVSSAVWTRVDEMAVGVLETAHSLASTQLSSGDKDEISKAVKALSARKRKAVADVMKDLRDAGLPPNLKPEVLAFQQNRPALMELVPLSYSAPAFVGSGELLKAEKYHHRLLHLLPQLRQTLNNHHSDIATRELQRCIAFAESSFAAALASRDRMFGRVQRTMDRVGIISNLTHASRLIAVGGEGVTQIEDLHATILRLTTALAQLEERSAALLPSHNTPNATPPFPADYPQLQFDLRSSLNDVSEIRKLVNLTQTPFITSGEAERLNQAWSKVLHACGTIERWSAESPRWSHIFLGVVNWLRPLCSSWTLSTTDPAEINGLQAKSRLTNAILVIMQNILACADATGQEPAEDYIRQQDRSLRRTAELLQGTTILSLLDELLLSMASSDGGISSAAEVVPYLKQYAVVMEGHLTELSRWSKSLYKLTYILCSILRTIADKGFCKPQDADESEEKGAEGTEKLEEGTGLGSGQGKENVSEQIEDESQVEGLRGEEDEHQEQRDEDEEDDKAIEMKDDFGGEMQDVDEKGREQDGEEEDEEEQSPEDQVGNLDPLDPNAVDEKLWGEKGGQEENDDQNQGPDQAPQNPSDGQSETVAREDDRRPQPDGKDKDDAPKESGPDEMEADDQAEEQEDGPDLDAPAPDMGAKMDEHVPQGDILDLPEDMEIGGEDGKSDEMDMEDDLGDLEGDEENVDEGKQQDRTSEMGDENSEAEESERKEAQEEDRDKDGEAELDEVPEVPHASRPDVDRNAAGDATVSAEEKEQGAAPNGGARQEQGEKSSDKPEEETDMVEGETSAEKQKESSKEVDDRADNEEATGRAQHEGQGSREEEEVSEMPNPIRNLGNALKDIRRRFQEILEPTSAERQTRADPKLQEDDDIQVEYLQDADTDENMQALGPSNPEDPATRLRDLKISEEEKSPHLAPLPDMGDVEMGDEERPTRLAAPDQLLPLPKSEADDANIEAALTEEQIRGDPSLRPVDESQEDDLKPSRVEQQEANAFESAEVELALRTWMDNGQPKEGADELWRLYSSLTQDLSSHLCEQLRLILEPTRATRLKGDYRTGKRLNMKKIIPYIASEFTKDKIWLRRTRPSQREYQVLVALDDSKSMSEGHSVHLAYETLALVTKALSRLEVGDVGVVRFGKTVDVLHGFDGAPFSDAEGAKVFGAFGFDQTATDVFSLIETSIKVLTEAREKKTTSSSSAAELWQLEIIISDGICQDHERLRALLRKAEEQRIMIVFVIVDSLRRSTASTSTATQTPSQNSILSMNQVSYKNINGRMELTMERYLDTFPFEYYVVLRNVEALPEVLSGTLKQFFERSSEP